MKHLRPFTNWLLMMLLVAGGLSFAAQATYGQTSGAQTAPELNITLGEQRVRFAPTRGFQEMRLEVVNSVGEIVFTHLTTEAEFDWNLRAANSEALAPGLYRYALTIKFGEELSRQHAGHFIVEQGQDKIWLTANDGTDVSGTVLNATRSGGRSLAGFRTTEDKSVKRDVSGRDLVDEKGSKLTDANQSSGKAAKQEKAALLGTLNKVAKFGVSGNADTDSTIFETGGGFVGIGTTAPTGALHVVSSAVNPLQIEMTGVPGAALTAQMDNFGGGGSTGGSGFLGRAANGSKLAPANVASGERLGFNVFGGYAGGGFRHVAAINGFVGTGTVSATSLPSYLNFMTTPDGSVSRLERMRIDQNGRVGIGVMAPEAMLHAIGSAPNGVYGISTATHGTGVVGAANFGTTAWGVYGYSNSGIGVVGKTFTAAGAGVMADGSGPTGTALRIINGGIKVVGAGLNTTTPVFIHQAVVPNIAGHITTIDHPLTNGDPNAILIVTPNFNPGGIGATLNNHPIGVFYVVATAKWTIFNQDAVAMPVSAAFNVLVIKP